MASVVEIVARHAHATFSRGLTEESFSECLAKLKKLVGQLKASDLNFRRDWISPQNVSHKSLSRAPVTYIEVQENRNFSMGIFVLKSGGRIPLHDHPGMYGVLKVIYGCVKITTFSALARAKGDVKIPRDISRRLNDREKDALLPMQQRTISDATENDDPFVLTPTENNFHEISAVGGSAAFLDILAPPYDMQERDCHYYTPLESSLSDAEVKIWLLKTARPPADFWCDSKEYLGPAVNL